ncbi:MAG: hypothetical protein WKF96_06285 [Solirubrobacteraceae bacterium]
MRLFLVLLPLSFALATSAPSQAAVPRDFVGVVTDDAFAGTSKYRARTLASQRKAGIGLIRLTFDWASIERTRGVYDFSLYDKKIAAAAKQDMSILAVLFNPPRFHSARPRRKALEGVYYPKNFAEMGKFGAAVAQRYGRNGTLWTDRPALPKVPLTAFQVWNEPNLRHYWPTGPSAKGYVALLKATGSGIRAVDPEAEIVTAGMPDSRISDPPFFTYLRQMYRAGARGTFDTLAVNAYAENVPLMMRILTRTRKVMRQNNDGASKLWVTEMGWSDRGPGSTYKAGVKGQARYIGGAIKAFARNRARLKLRGFVYYSWRDGRPYAPKFQDFWGLHTGLLNRRGKPKPAFTAFKSAATGLNK